MWLPLCALLLCMKEAAKYLPRHAVTSTFRRHCKLQQAMEAAIHERLSAEAILLSCVISVVTIEFMPDYRYYRAAPFSIIIVMVYCWQPCWLVTKNLLHTDYFQSGERFVVSCYCIVAVFNLFINRAARLLGSGPQSWWLSLMGQTEIDNGDLLKWPIRSGSRRHHKFVAVHFDSNVQMTLVE